ncbi:MAG: hypothetical protein HY721_20875, partial [Planctomycetes bacterium]|nr:hypothetical protein [Planctomycetota bacterium]
MLRTSSIRVTVASVLALAGQGRLHAQATSSDVLSLSAGREGEAIRARVFLDAIQAGVQGLSFAVCHSTGDVLLEDALVGSGVLSITGGRGAEYLAVRTGASSGQGFATMTAVLDFEGRTVFPIGSHEVLALQYSLRPGGTGKSLKFCAAGEPPVETYVVREGRGAEPTVRLLDAGARNKIRVGVVSSTSGGAWVPIYLTTDREGLTGFTVVLCHSGGIGGTSVSSVDATPELLPFGPGPPEQGVIVVTCEGEEDPTLVGEPSASLAYNDLCPIGLGSCLGNAGIRVSVQLERPLPRVTDLPVLHISYGGASSAIRPCQVGRDVECGLSFFDPCSNTEDTVTALRFGEETVLPEVQAGAVNITTTGVVAGYLLKDVSVASPDPLDVKVWLFQPFSSDRSLRAFETSVAFDPALFEVVEEPSVEDHRAKGLVDWMKFEGSPVTETRRYEEGYFIHFLDFGQCGTSTGSLCQPISLLKFCLARKGIPVPGGLTAKVAGGPFPLRFQSAVVGGRIVAVNRYQDLYLPFFDCEPPTTKTPRLTHGSLTIADSKVAFSISSADVQVFEPASIAVSLEAPVRGIRGIEYTVRHDPKLLSVERLETSPALVALRPVSSNFEQLPDGFTHTVVLDAARTLGPTQGVPLALVDYRPVGAAGASSRVEVVTSSDRRPVVAFPVGGSLVAYVPMKNLAGEVHVKHDPTLLGYRIAGGRVPPGGTLVASVLLDAGARGVRTLRGTLCHDPALAVLDPAYLGQDARQLGAALAGVAGLEHSLVARAAGDGVAFEARWSGEGLPAAQGQELFRVGYRLTGRYGDALRLELCEAEPAGAGGALQGGGGEGEGGDDSGEQGGGGGEVEVRSLGGGAAVLTDELAASISPADTPPGLKAVAVTELGWRWGLAEGSNVVRHYGTDGQPFGPEIALDAEPRRVANGGEGWAWVSYPGHVAILRFDALETTVPVGGEPHGIAADRERNAWVAVAGEPGRLLRIARDGRVLRDVPLGPGRGEPRELAIDEEGGIWVAYEGLDALSRVAPDGALVRPAAARIPSGRPAGLAADGRGTIWASDAGERALVAFHLRGIEKRRVALEAEPADVSVDGAGSLWTVLKGEGGGRLVRIDLREDGHDVVDAGPSSTLHGDRTGLATLRLLLPEEDNDEDEIPNLVEVKNASDPLDAADPPAERSVPPVRRLAASVLSVRLGPGGIENKVGVSWVNAAAYTGHEVRVDGVVALAGGPGEATSAVLEAVRPGPARVSMTSFLAERSSPESSTAVQVGPGAAVRVGELDDLEAVDLAVDEAGGRRYVLDGRRNEVLVLDKELVPLERFAVPPPFGGDLKVLAGIAFRPPGGAGGAGGAEGRGADGRGAGGAGEGSLVILDGSAGRYVEITTLGALAAGPFEVPFAAGGAFFEKLEYGEPGGEPTLFTIARGPQNDCIIFFRFGGAGPASEVANPLAGTARLTLGGLTYLPGGGEERLWIATGLEGEVLPRLVLGVPLDGAGSVEKIFLSVFEQPGGIPALRGVELSSVNGDLFALTSDRRLHQLSDFGVSGEGEAPEITQVAAGAGGGG